MKIKILLVPVLLIVFSAITADAQIGIIKQAIKDKSKTEKAQETKNNSAETVDKNNADSNTSTDKKKTYSDEDPNFMFIGKDGLGGKEANGFSVCAQNFNGDFPLKDKFKKWDVVNLNYAREDMYQEGKCDLMGLIVSQRQGYKYQNADSFKVLAQGGSVYRVEGNELVLVKDFTAVTYYVAVSPAVNKPGLKLKELNLGVHPDLKESFVKRVNNINNYHNLNQALYIFERYKKYPSDLQANSALFNGEDFETLNKQGKLKGLVIYKLEGNELVPFK